MELNISILVRGWAVVAVYWRSTMRSWVHFMFSPKYFQENLPSLNIIGDSALRKIMESEK